MTKDDHYPIARFADWVRKSCIFIDGLMFQPTAQGHTHLFPIYRPVIVTAALNWHAVNEEKIDG